MSMYHVYKKEWSQYTESQGCIVIASTWQRAKGIAMAQSYWEDQTGSNIVVEEIDVVEEGILCTVDGIINSAKYN